MDIRRIDNPPEVPGDLEYQKLSSKGKLKFVLAYLKKIEEEEERAGISDFLNALRKDWNMVI